MAKINVDISSHTSQSYTYINIHDIVLRLSAGMEICYWTLQPVKYITNALAQMSVGRKSVKFVSL